MHQLSKALLILSSYAVTLLPRLVLSEKKLKKRLNAGSVVPDQTPTLTHSDTCWGEKGGAAREGQRFRMQERFSREIQKEEKRKWRGRGWKWGIVEMLPKASREKRNWGKGEEETEYCLDTSMLRGWGGFCIIIFIPCRENMTRFHPLPGRNYSGMTYFRWIQVFLFKIINRWTLN